MGRSICSRTARWVQGLLLAMAVAVASLPAHAATVRYVYDELGRLTAAIDPEGDTVEYTYDDVGNLLAVTRRSTVEVSIVSFSPSSGFVGQGVTVVGTGFDTSPAANTVRFNGVAAVVSAATPTQITTSVPAGATTGRISVSNSRGSATSATDFTVTLPQPPTIASFAPLIASPGTPVTVSGANFASPAGANDVKVNAVTATVQSASADTLVFVTPMAAGGKIRVTTAAGSATSANDFFIAPPPHAAGDVGFTGRVAINGSASPVVLAATKVALVLMEASAGETGLRVAVSDATFAFGATLAVFKPDGTLLASSASPFSASGSLALPALPVAGTYTVVLIPASGRSGSASLSVVRDVSAALQRDVPFDFIVTTHGQQGLFTFSGVAGETLALAIENVTFPGGGTVTVRQPNGSVLLAATTFAVMGGSVRLPTLPAAGTYTLEVVPAGGPGRATFTLRLINDIDVGMLTVDTPQSVSFTTGGQIARARFNATAGEVLGIGIKDITLSGGSYRVLGPGGGLIIPFASFTSSVHGIRLGALPLTGVYTIEITAGGTQPGSLALAVWRDVDGGSLVVDGPAGRFTVTYPGQQLRFRFDGTGGTVVGLRVVDVTSTAGMNFQLKRASGTVVQSFSVGNSNVSFAMGTLPATETYTMEVFAINNGTASFTASVWRNVDGGSIAYDETKEITVANAGQLARLTFTGAIGDLAGLQVVPTGMTLNLVVRRPDGVLVLNSSFGTGGGSARMGTLTQAGTYTIEIFPINNATGSARVTLWKDVDVTLTVDASQATAFAIAYPTQQARLRFDALANTSAGVQFALSGSTANVLVRRPDGVLILNTSFGLPGGSARIGTLTQNGVHTVEFIPINNGIGNFSAKVWIDVAATLAYGETRDLAIPSSGQQAKITFNGAIGDNPGVQLSQVTLGSGASVLVRRPDGVLILNSSVGTGGGSLRIPTLTQAGPHTIEVIPINNGTGAVRAGLWKDVEAQLVPDAAAPTPITIAFANQQARLKFEAVSGMNVGFALGSSTLPFGTAILVRRPDGVLVLNTSVGAGGGSVRIPTITQNGTHLIEIIPINGGAGSFSAKVWADVALSMAYGDSHDIAIPNAGQQARIAFTGVIGENAGVNLTSVSLGSGAAVLVRRPDGVLVLNTSIGPGGGSLRIPTITQAGTHSIEVIPINNGTGSVRATLWKDVAATLAYGEFADLTIPNGNQQARIAFAGAPGDGAGFLVSAMTLSSLSAGVLVRRPDGVIVVNTNITASGGAVRIGTLTQAGTHLVDLAPVNGATGGFRFTLWRDVTGALMLGQPAAVAIPFVHQQAALAFETASGVDVRLVVSDVAFGSSVGIQVFNPSGAILVNTSFGPGGFTQDLSFSAPGVYRIVLMPNFTTGSATVRIDSR